jgi:hypothetical protein
LQASTDQLQLTITYIKLKSCSVLLQNSNFDVRVTCDGILDDIQEASSKHGASLVTAMLCGRSKDSLLQNLMQVNLETFNIVHATELEALCKGLVSSLKHNFFCKS